MICDSPFAGFNYFSPWADSQFLHALFALGRSHALSTADLSPQRDQHQRQPSASDKPLLAILGSEACSQDSLVSSFGNHFLIVSSHPLLTRRKTIHFKSPIVLTAITPLMSSVMHCELHRREVINSSISTSP